MATYTLEERIAHAILGQKRASVLMTDAYKFAMAQAGFPLRNEKFYLTFRKGGPFYIPFDLAKVVQALLPDLPTAKEAGFLVANGYPMSTAMETAVSRRSVEVWCPPVGSWVGKHAPVLTVSGPSFLVSWLEPLLLMLHYPIQIATAARHGKRTYDVTCADEETLLRLVEESLQIPEGEPGFNLKMDIGYPERVRGFIKAVLEALEGDATRAFEVGFRAAVCVQQHLMVLDVCESLGVRKTSNVYGAWKLYMIPVGTTGHEHQMRWDAVAGNRGDDVPGFEAIRDMRPEPPSYLFDTFDAIAQGIPAAFRTMQADPGRHGTMRFDSGNQQEQFVALARTFDALWDKGVHLDLTLIFEDSYDAQKTQVNERFCNRHRWPISRRHYGYGGHWVSSPARTIYTRDNVSAAYKLSMTGGKPVNKATVSKASLPGNPRILERQLPVEGGMGNEFSLEQLVAQEGEVVAGFTEPQPHWQIPSWVTVLHSPQTQALLAQLSCFRSSSAPPSAG